MTDVGLYQVSIVNTPYNFCINKLRNIKHNNFKVNNEVLSLQFMGAVSQGGRRTASKMRSYVKWHRKPYAKTELRQNHHL